ncbi:T6SS effector BTH_I2691 family protein [Stenotrophomonas rhizophila]
MNDAAADYCPNCIRFGFPILLARYAVARTDAEVRRRAPPLQAPFGSGVQDIVLPASDAQYTLRLLRGGYVYAFNETRDEWLAWQVNEHGDLSSFDIRDTSPPPQNDDAPASCSRHGSAMMSKCIVLPDAKWGTTLWLAFSAAPWTAKVWRRHQDAAYRQRSMRRIDMAGWVGSGNPQPHMASLYQTLDQVAEFHLVDTYSILPKTPDATNLPRMEVLPGAHALAHSLSGRVQYAQHQLDLLRAQARLAARQDAPDHPLAVAPALVALDDPVGIIADLNQLAVTRLLEWENEPERQEKRQTAAAITALRETIEQGALEDETHRRRRNAMAGRGLVTTLGGRTVAEQMSRSLPLWTDDVFAVADEDVGLKLGAASWKKYRQYLREDDGYARWLKETYVAEQVKFYEHTISALDDAYIAWLSSAGFKQYMTGNFDSTDTTSGVLYQEAVTALLQDATSRGKVFQYVLERLEQGDPLNPDEILLRAQVWNQDGLIAVWKDALAQASSAPNARDWMVAANGLSNAFKGMLDNPLKGQVSGYHGPKRLVDMYRGAARLLEQLSGPVTRMVGNEIGSMAAVGVGTLPARWQIGLLTALGQSSSPGTALIDLTGYTTPKRARKALAMTLAGRAGLNAAQQASAAAAESIASSSATIEGGRFKFGMVALADADQLKLFKALNAKAVIAGPARQAQLMGTLTVLDLHDAMRTTVSGLHRSSYGYGIAALVLMSASLGELNKQILKAPVEGRGLLQANFAAGVAALVGDAAIVLGEMGSKLPWLSRTLAEPMGRWMFKASTRAAVLQAGGRWLSGGAGGIVGALSVWEGYKDMQLSKGYGIAMISGGLALMISAALILFGALVPVATVLFIFAAIVTVIAAWLKPDQIERWLDRAMHFGKNKTGVFPDITSQSTELVNLKA